MKAYEKKILKASGSRILVEGLRCNLGENMGAFQIVESIEANSTRIEKREEDFRDI